MVVTPYDLYVPSKSDDSLTTSEWLDHINFKYSSPDDCKDVREGSNYPEVVKRCEYIYHHARYAP